MMTWHLRPNTHTTDQLSPSELQPASDYVPSNLERGRFGERMESHVEANGGSAYCVGCVLCTIIAIVFILLFALCAADVGAFGDSDVEVFGNKVEVP